MDLQFALLLGARISLMMALPGGTLLAWLYGLLWVLREFHFV